MNWKTESSRNALRRLVIFTMFVPSAFAGGHGGGNGGNAVVCFSNPSIPRAILALPENERVIPNWALSEITSIEALDLFEARAGAGDLDGPKGGAILSTSASEKTSEFLERIAMRFDHALPLVAEEIRTGRAAFSGKVTRHSNGDGTAGVPQVRDIGNLPYLIDKNRCVISTIINQSGMDGTLSLSIDDRLFTQRRHSELSRKTLMLHEVLYLWGRRRGQTDSQGVRALVGLALRTHLLRSKVIEVLSAYGFAKRNDPNSTPLYPEDAFLEKVTRLADSGADKAGETLFKFFYYTRPARSEMSIQNYRELRASYYSDPYPRENLSELARNCEDEQPPKSEKRRKEWEANCAEIRKEWAQWINSRPQYDADTDWNVENAWKALANAAQEIDRYIHGEFAALLDPIAGGRCEHRNETLEAFSAAISHRMEVRLASGIHLGEEMPAVPVCDDFEIPVFDH